MNNNLMNDILETYNKNLEFIKSNNDKLYKKIILLDDLINNGQYSQKYELEYVDNSFDILELSTQQYMYNKQSVTHTDKTTQDVSIDNQRNNFNPYKHYKYSDNDMKEIANENLYPVFNSIHPSVAPIINYVNHHAPIKAEVKKLYKFIFVGTGLGLHIESIHNKIQANVYLVIEPNLEIFRLSLFTTKYFEIARDCSFVFSIANEDDQEFISHLREFADDGVGRNNNWKFNVFSDNHKYILKNIQDYIVAQNHLKYPFYLYIYDSIRTYQYWANKYKFLNLSKQYENLHLSKKPFILIGAGPSLQKNIEFLKNNSNKFIIAVAFSALPVLYKNNITPDIVLHIDSGIINANTLDQINKDFLKNTLFLFGTNVPLGLSQKLNKKNIFCMQMNNLINSEIGNITGDTSGDFLYTLLLILGVENIYLLGLDLAIDPETNKTHSDGHILNLDALSTDNTIKEGMNTTNHDINTIRVKGNFRDHVYTQNVYYSAIHTFKYTTMKLKRPNQNVYNLNDGAYLEGTIPLNISKLSQEIKNFDQFDKESLSKSLYNEINSIATNKLKKQDKIFIQEKLNHAYNMKKVIKIYKNYPESNNFQEFELILSELIQYLIDPKELGFNDINVLFANYFRYILHFIYEFFNKKDIDKEEEHLKNIKKILVKILVKIINTYIKEVEKYYKLLK